MKTLFLILVAAISLEAQVQVPLGEVVHMPDLFTFSPSTGVETAADTIPKCSVYEEDTDTAIIILGSMVLRTATTNDYRYSFTASAANGFEIGKWYNGNCYAAVEAIDGNANKMHFRVVAPEPFEGSSLALRTGTAQAGATTSITLDAGASAVTNFYVNTTIQITGGTGAGQARLITAYNGTTKVATVGTWATTPGASSTFAILPTDLAPVVLFSVTDTFVRGIAVPNYTIFMQTPSGVALTGLTTGQITCYTRVDGAAWSLLGDTTETEVGGAGNGKGEYLVDLTATETDGDIFNLLCTGPGAIDYRVVIITQH